MIPSLPTGALLSVAAGATDLPLFSRRTHYNALDALLTGSAVGGSRLVGLNLEANSSSLPNEDAASGRIQVTKGSGKTVRRLVPQQASFEQKIFDCVVQLKVAVATYAMHLPSAERHRIFDRLDSVINIEDWHEEDRLPVIDSFRSFLKWLVYSNRFDWSSIGVSTEGVILVAWSQPRVAVTASFAASGRVTWTARVEPEEEGEEPNHMVGSGSPQSFADHARFYLDGPSAHAGHKHP